MRRMLFARLAATLTVVGVVVVPLRAVAHEVPANVPEEARQMRNPLPAKEQAVQAGRAVYEEHCLSCHGPAGRGDGPLAKTFHHPPPELGEVLRRQTDGEIHWKVLRGGGAMPSFEKTLTQKELWQVVHYLRTFGKKGKGRGR